MGGRRAEKKDDAEEQERQEDADRGPRPLGEMNGVRWHSTGRVGGIAQNGCVARIQHGIGRWDGTVGIRRTAAVASPPASPKGKARVLPDDYPVVILPLTIIPPCKRGILKRLRIRLKPPGSLFRTGHVGRFTRGQTETLTPSAEGTHA